MRWTAEALGADVYHLDADITYCPDDGQITDFELTPSVAGGADFVLGLIGFEPRVNDVSYSPPRSTYPAQTVTGTARFDLCFSPSALIGRFAGKQLDGQVTRAIEWVLNRNLRRSGEWTAASLRFGLQAARDDVLRAAVREIRRLPGLRGTAEDAIAELVEGTLREVLNKVIAEVLDAAGPAEVLGMTPDEAAVWAARELLGRIPSVCAPMRVWEPEVTIVGRPLQEPLQPSTLPGYTNPFISVSATTPGE